MKQHLENKLRLLGGIVPIGRTLVPMPNEELLSIETALGVVLPEDYREFVAKYGACGFGEIVQFQIAQPEPVHLTQSFLPNTIARYEKGPFSDFYGSKAGTNGLSYYIEVYRGRMPDCMIPIADDGGGNQICLGIKGVECGKVYYWDHHNEWDEEDFLEDYGEPMPPEVKFQNVYLIANSFEEFLMSVEKVPNA